MDSTKRCKDCERTKKKTEFYVSKVVRLKSGKTSVYVGSYCKACHRKRSYADDRSRRDANLMRIWRYLETHPCKVCGENNPVVLSFDHRDGSSKSANLADLMKRNWKEAEAELEKCDVLCMNHHAIRTAAQLNWFRSPELRSYVEAWPENKKAYKETA